MQGEFPPIPDDVATRAQQIENQLLTVRPRVFAELLPYLTVAFTMDESLFKQEKTSSEQWEFTFDYVLNGLSLLNGLQKQKELGFEINADVFNKAFSQWASYARDASLAAARDENIPPILIFPETPPALDSQSGALPEGYSDWSFFAVQSPLGGTLDLTKNPPVYTPGSTFGQADNYRIRACQRIVADFCTAERALTVSRPQAPLSVTLKTTTGNSSLFARGNEVVCEPVLRSTDHTPVFTWWLQKFGETQLTNITHLAVQPARLTLTSTGINDRIFCRVFAESNLGLWSASPKDSNSLVATNSPPADMTLTPPEGYSILPVEEHVDSSMLHAPDPGLHRKAVPKITVSDLDPFDSLPNLDVTECDGLRPCPLFRVDDLESAPELRRAVLYMIAPLNFEAKAFHTLKILGKDSAGAELEKEFRLDVINKNDPMKSLSPLVINVQENEDNTHTPFTVADVECAPTAACQNTNYTYSFENILAQGSNQDSSFFEINGRSLRFNGSRPDYEHPHGPEYQVMVKVTDLSAIPGDPMDVKTFFAPVTIRISDTSEAPTGVTISQSDFDENQPMGTVVGLLAAIDADSGQSDDPNQFEYTLKEPQSLTGNFEIVGRALKIKKQFDFEAIKDSLGTDSSSPNSRYFEVEVTATEKVLSILRVTQSIKIFLNDVNEAPTDILVSKNVLQELLPETDVQNVIDLSATDPDATVQTFQYRIARVNRNGESGGALQAADQVAHPFVVVGAALKTNRPLVYANEGGVSDRSYTLDIVVSDGGLEFSKIITVFVSSLTLSGTSFDENELAADLPEDPQNSSQISRKLVGNLCVESVQSVPCSEWTFSMKVPVNGIKIVDQKLYRIRAFNFETEPTLNITIVASRGATQMERSFVLAVNDRNDPPSSVVFHSLNPPVNGKYFVLEGEAALTPVGYFSVSDEDANDIFDWDFSSSVPDGASFFTITRRANSREADLRVAGQSLPVKSSTRTSLKVLVKADDASAVATRFVEFFLVSNAKLAVESTPAPSSIYDMGNQQYSLVVYDKQTSSGPLNVDFRIIDDSDAAQCVVSSGPTTAGVFWSGVSSTLIDSISISEKSSGSGFKICIMSFSAKPNRSGDSTVNLGIRWSTAVGVRTSNSVLPLKIAFWRAPELSCPSRVLLPPGTPLSGVPCTVIFSDESGQGVNTDLVLGIQNCSLNLNAGRLSLSSFPSQSCSTSVSWTGTNKYQSHDFSLSKTIALEPRKFSVNGAVKALSHDNVGHIYLGGSFTAVNPRPARAIAALGTEAPDLGRSSGSCLLTDGFNGSVRAIADAGDGSFWVGGDFNHHQSVQVNHLTRLRCSGERVQWLPAGTGFDGPVHSIAVALDGSVYIAGRFSSYNGIAAVGVVRLDRFGVRDAQFQSGLPANSVVNALALTPATGLSSDVQTVWLGGVFDGDVSALSVVSGGVVVGGRFTAYRSQSALRLIKLDDVGLIDVPFYAATSTPGSPYAGGFNGRVDALTNDGAAVYVGGGFSSYRGQSVSYLAKLSLSNGALLSTEFNGPTLNSAVRSLVLIDNASRLLLGGQFTTVNTQARSGVALVDAASGSVVSEFNDGVGFNGSVLALAPFAAENVLLVGGEFTTVGGSSSSRLARFSTDGVFDAQFTAGMGSGGFNADVEALSFSQSEQSLYAGGAFTRVGPTPVGSITKLNAGTVPERGTPVSSFNTNAGSGFNGMVKSLAQAPGGVGLYVGGRFESFNSISAPRLVRLTHSGNVDDGFALGNGFTSVTAGTPTINAITVGSADLQNNHALFVAGEFDRFKDEPALRLVKLDSQGELVPNFNVSSGANQEIHALAMRSADLFVGGQFTEFAGSANALRLANVNAETGVLSTGGAFSVNGPVRTLFTDDSGGVYVGGSFSSFDGAITGPLTRLMPDNTRDSSVNAVGTSHLNSATVPGIFAVMTVNAVHESNPVKLLFTGGVFSSFKNIAAAFAVRLNPDAAAEAPLP